MLITTIKGREYHLYEGKDSITLASYMKNATRTSGEKINLPKDAKAREMLQRAIAMLPEGPNNEQEGP